MISTSPPSSQSLVRQVFDLLADHCTFKDGGRNTFVRRVNEVLEKSTLDSSKDIDALWIQTWDKPLYADQFAYIASDLIDKLRAQIPPPLDDFRRLPSEPDLLKGLKRYTLKHQRLLALGSVWDRIFELHIQTVRGIQSQQQTQESQQTADLARREMGAPGYAGAKDASRLFDAITAVKGYGKITALHICTDLGYPVYKPDRWLLRFAAMDPSVRQAIERKLRAGVTLDHVTQGYLERHLELVLVAIDHLTEAFAREPQPLGVVDLDLGFRRHRFVDLMIAKFGMTPERQFGIEISGKDLLLRDSSHAQRYPHLCEIAQEMDRAAKAKMQARRARHRAKASV